jgi:pyrroline-5-carboxylate reductase
MANKITIIGGGNLGVAIAEGLISSKHSKAGDITITRRNVSLLDGLKKNGTQVESDNIKAVKNANIILLCVKPFQTKDVLKEISRSLNTKQILISVVTGVSIEEINHTLNKHHSENQKGMPVFRAMPNTAIAIAESMTCIAYENADSKQIQTVSKLFDTLGKTVVIEEKLMEAATIIGACGTAFAMRYIRANIQGGIEIGFDANTARTIVAQTVKGAAELLIKNGTHPEQEIDKVTTPKGCTIAGLNEMEHNGLSSSLIKGITESYKKIAK